jgi:Spy/CpxP family protein refolding chaperone
MNMKKVLALVVAAAMGLSSAAFAAETTTSGRCRCNDHCCASKTVHHKNTTKPLNLLQSRKRSR